MFIDIALLVQAQGEMLDNIEINVQTAENYVKKANVQLKKAKKSHQRSRKVSFWIKMSDFFLVRLNAVF